ncbi:hypothetical protein EOT10_28345 [Streptomyces antnestii]|uniref:Uncharacterized protein n=1 Tax=Streptomyces antnestii TaxID=2494256 RepID=A0A437PCH7_9ACTN|nr:hypothetical protein [Streptomyces sp. San01]RVU19925.1 hypothetical protein EOT10_28345 [Streptomyces sp. San01]
MSEALTGVWPLLAVGEPGDPLHAGVGSPAPAPADLNGALSEARYALCSARATAPHASHLTDTSALTGLERC